MARVSTDGINWVECDGAGLPVIRRRLKGLDETGRLLEQQMPLYERFLLTEA